MKDAASGVRALLVVALVVIFGACAAAPSLVASHIEGSDVCCGLAECSALATGLLSLMVPIVAVPMRHVTTPSGRSAALQPIPPPPEPLLLGAA